ncbi:PfkB family carbohydrate kinase [Geminicoccaceae bacterium 1502E]|nr:PfkB family carbohydrate kinase [Geminicoccaceae bacterium 1502E]
MLLVPGSINADLLFRVRRLPRPGETVLCPGHEFAPGGKGANQAAAAARAGATVEFVGQVGEDAYGPVMRRCLEEAGVGCARVAVSRRATGLAVIGIDEAGENSIIVASGANLDTNAGQIEPGLLGPGVTLLCQNEIRSEETFAALARGRAEGARTILNLAPAAAVPAEVLDCLDVLVVNEHEAAVLAGEGEAEALARALARRHGLTCVVTLGAAGALAVAPGGGLRVPCLKVEVVDTTGAGDAFAGVLAGALDMGLPMEEALRHSAVAAGITCEGLGAQTAQPDSAAIQARLPALGPCVSLPSG